MTCDILLININKEYRYVPNICILTKLESNSQNTNVAMPDIQSNFIVNFLHIFLSSYIYPIQSKSREEKYAKFLKLNKNI